MCGKYLHDTSVIMNCTGVGCREGIATASLWTLPTVQTWLLLDVAQDLHLYGEIGAVAALWSIGAALVVALLRH